MEVQLSTEEQTTTEDESGVTDFRIRKELMAAFEPAADELSTSIIKKYSDKKALSLVNGAMDQRLDSLVFSTTGGAKKRNKRQKKKKNRRRWMNMCQSLEQKYQLPWMKYKRAMHGPVLRSETSSRRQMKRGTMSALSKGLKYS